MSTFEKGTTVPNAGPSDLVVIGSSAGGVEALSILVSTLPANFPSPIVLAQHLDPNRPSSLDTILQRRTNLAVEVVQSRSRLQAGKIYVVPSNRHVAINDSLVEVQSDHGKRPRPSVDLLLSSAAHVYGERLIAVILTGSGSDGAAGAVEVKDAGGIVIVQNPQTARYPSMPMALPPTVIDFEVDLERIGPLLNDLLTGASLPPPEEKTEDTLRVILELVSHQVSIDFRPYKTSTILRRIGRRMAVTHHQTIRDYADYLMAHPGEIGELVKAFLINVTQFFRDPEAFAFLKSDVLPKLVVQARERDRVLRFWTAGCATGEESYSLAMLITDMLGAELSQWSVKIFATDLDEAAIAFARRGLYTENLLGRVPANYRERFFERVDMGYRISKALRQMVIFGQQDLSRSAPFPRIDLVLCRNVLIYFMPELQDYVLSQFVFSLSLHGFLFLGKAETVRPAQSYYELYNKQWKVYRCLGGALPMVRRQNSPDLHMRRAEGAFINQQKRSGGKLLAEQEVPQPEIEIGQLRRLNELLLRFLPIGVVVIDRSYRILTANGSARRLLGLREGGNEQDFLHAVRGIPYSNVREAIDAVFRERNTITLPEVELDIAIGGSGRSVSLSIGLMQLEAGAPDLAVISVTDVTEQIQVRKRLEEVQAEHSHLMNELSTSNKRLNDVNKELLDANEELQVANEELMLTHEELQATIEEFETTNEELQATNEELETNNEELQATNEELETTNEELRARTHELQELSDMLEGERVRLTEIVQLAPFYIMVLRGPSLIVEAINSGYTSHLEGRNVQGRPLEDVADTFWENSMTIVGLAREVYRQNIVHTLPRMLIRLPNPGNESTESYLVHTLIPSHDAEGHVSGVIIYARDETEQQAKEAEEELKRLKLIFDNVSTAALALYDARTAELIIGSPRYLDIVSRLHKLDGNDLTDRKWSQLMFLAPREQAEHLWQTSKQNHAPLRLPEIRLKTSPDEQERVWSGSLTPILDTDKPDTVRFILVSAVEVTELVEQRQEMERLNRLKDDFLALASHELRTPLTSILGNTEILQRRLRRLSKAEIGKSSLDSEEQVLANIIQQVQRLSRLIDEILDITRIRSEQFEIHNREDVNVVALVHRLVEQQRSIAANHILVAETPEEKILVTCDEARIEQVIDNLLSNAIKYSPAHTPIYVKVERKTSEVIIAVQDHGAGIGEEEQKHIFERFYRTRTEGTTNIEGLGLGLYIAREIVMQEGGRMCVESQPGSGSTFYFSLHLSTKEK